MIRPGDSFFYTEILLVFSIKREIIQTLPTFPSFICSSGFCLAYKNLASCAYFKGWSAGFYLSDRVFHC
jgi:hypothetical protein